MKLYDDSIAKNTTKLNENKAKQMKLKNKRVKLINNIKMQ